LWDFFVRFGMRILPPAIPLSSLCGAGRSLRTLFGLRVGPADFSGRISPAGQEIMPQCVNYFAIRILLKNLDVNYLFGVLTIH
jgi:hypothetical protein